MSWCAMKCKTWNLSWQNDEQKTIITTKPIRPKAWKQDKRKKTDNSFRVQQMGMGFYAVTLGLRVIHGIVYSPCLGFRVQGSKLLKSRLLRGFYRGPLSGLFRVILGV